MGPAEPGSAVDGSWVHAPCSLLEVDEHGVVVAANDRFLIRSFYRLEDLVGRMRWLDLLTVGSRIFVEAQLGPLLALNAGQDEVMVELVRADGTRLPALMNVEVVTDAAGHRSGLRIALMTVPDRRRYEDSLRAGLQLAERASAESTRIREHLQLLARANAALVSTLDVATALGRLARVLQSGYADWCVIYTVGVDRADELSEWASAHRVPACRERVAEVAALLPAHTSGESLLTRVLREDSGRLVAQVTEEHLRAATTSPELLELLQGLDVASALVVPGLAHHRHAAVIVLVRGAARAPFDQQDLDDVTELAARTSIAIDNLRLYAREHNYSVELQQALLTTPPEQDEVQVQARYLPASNGVEIGGDWYDAFRQRDGNLVFAIGDVMGHDVHAASAMGQLRGVIRTVAHVLNGTPAAILTAADETAHGLGVGVNATAIVARLLADGDGSRRVVEWSNAGHLPPVLIDRTGAARILEERAEPMLGVSPGRPRHDHRLELAAGDTLLLYTDGLIERRQLDIDTAMARLVEAVTGTQCRPLDELCDGLLARFAGGRDDDVALLAIRLR